MKKENRPQLNFRFHNPNSEATTRKVILSVFFEVNKKKLQAAIDKELEEREKNGADEVDG